MADPMAEGRESNTIMARFLSDRRATEKPDVPGAAMNRSQIPTTRIALRTKASTAAVSHGN